MNKKKNKENQLRIIGGEWRGRKVSFSDAEGLRPSPDRVRETLFNWLQPSITGSHCLDLFSGSGALGLEALSRGAAEVHMVDRNRQIIQHLQQQLVLLGNKKGHCHYSEAVPFLSQPAKQRFDIVFLDPPYRQNMLPLCCELLEKNGWLEDQALIYIEAEKELGEPSLPDNWQLIRSKKAGQVGYHLATRNSEG